MRAIRVCSAAILLNLVSSGVAHAHDLGAEVKIVKGRVVVEAYYDDGTSARGAKVKIHDADRRVVAQGETNKKGVWSFPVPKPGPYEAAVNAGGGHLTRVKFTVKESAGTSAPPNGVEPSPGAPDSGDTVENSEPARDMEVVSTGPSRAEFTQTPWLKLGIGLGVIGALAAAMFVATRLNRPARHPATPDDAPTVE